MARVHGKNSNFSYNAVAIEDELNSIGISFEVPEGEITAFADAWGNFLAGKPNVKTDIAGALDMAASQGDVTLFAGFGAGPVTTVFDPDGSGPAADSPEYTCTASGLTGVLIESYNISLPVGGAATYTATLQHSGNTTRAVA